MQVPGSETNGQPTNPAPAANPSAITEDVQKAARNEKIKETLISTAKVAGQATLTILSAAVFGYVLGATLRGATKFGAREVTDETTVEHHEHVEAAPEV